MTAQPYLIANLRTGVERDLEPWLLPEDAFPNLEDCYLFRGRIQRRRGFTGLGRLVTKIGSAVGAAFAGNIPYIPLTPRSVHLIVGGIIFVDDGAGILIGTPALNTGTVNYATGAITLAFNPALVAPTDVNYIDMLPVMGLQTRELTVINEEQLIAFDTIKANNFSTAAQAFVDNTFYKTSGTAFSWTGTDADFFWTDNYLSAFWVTNGTRGFQPNPTANAGTGDGIRWFDGTGWVNFLPQIDNIGPNFLMGARIIVNYRNRLLVLNTFEGTAYGTFTQFRQRARWCQNGTPYYNAVLPAGFPGTFQVDAWNSDIPGKGGFIDAPTSEEIISAQFYKDTLIVFFERSTWQLRYTGNELLPFIWERINVELGAESTFSIVPFDSGMVAVGNYGIVTCDSTGVRRIDQIIPDEVFNIHNKSDGVKRVYGIRDYTQQLIYWTFPDADLKPKFPNKVLIYNYLDGSYSFFNDSFTCFGAYQPFNDITWADLARQWQATPIAWNNGQFQSDYPLIVAGNQQGYVFSEINRGPIENAFSLQIIGVTQANPGVITSTNHNLSEGTIIRIAGVLGMTQLNNNIYRVSKPITANTFIIQTLDVNGNFINVDTTAFTAYISDGQIKVRNNFVVETKRFNPFLKDGDQLRLQNVDFFVETNDDLAFTCTVFLDENDNTSVEQDAIMPTSNFSGKVWIRTYFSIIGQFAQLQLTFDNEQMFDATMSDADVTIHAMMLWMSRCGRLTYGVSF